MALWAETLIFVSAMHEVYRVHAIRANPVGLPDPWMSRLSRLFLNWKDIKTKIASALKLFYDKEKKRNL